MSTIEGLCKKRLCGDIKLLKKDPHKYIDVSPDEKDLLTWYFLVKGPEFSDFNGGYYIGKIMHNPEYPFKSPDFMMLTPNGRFDINKKICLSNSSYHSSEWSAMWTIHAILTGFLSIMLDDKENGISHIHQTKSEREIAAKNSIEYNKRYHPEIIKLFTRFIDENGNPKIESNPTPTEQAGDNSNKSTNEPKPTENKPPETIESKPNKHDKVKPEPINKQIELTKNDVVNNDANLKKKNTKIKPLNIVIEDFTKTDKEYENMMKEIKMR